MNGTDVVHLLHRHGAEDCLSVAARDCDKNVAAERTTSLVAYKLYITGKSLYEYGKQTGSSVRKSVFYCSQYRLIQCEYGLEQCIRGVLTV